MDDIYVLFICVLQSDIHCSKINTYNLQCKKGPILVPVLIVSLKLKCTYEKSMNILESSFLADAVYTGFR